VSKEKNMTENQTPQPDLASQFKELGENLKNMFQSAWESEEANQFKNELKNGFNELGNAATEAVENFNASEAGENLKAEADEFVSRVESGEVEAKARDEISKALKIINTELEKAIDSFAKPHSDPEA
jgi:hypothetical protein